MPAPISGVDVLARVLITSQLHSNAVYNVTYLHALEADAPTSFATLLAALLASWQTQIVTQQSASLFFTGMSVQQIFPVMLPAEETVTSVAGGVADQAVANQCAQVIKKQTGSTGRTKRGRWYLGGLPESAFNGATGLWTTAGGNAARLDTWASVAEGLDWYQAVVSNKTSPMSNFERVVSHVGRLIPGVIRRRRLGVGI